MNYDHIKFFLYKDIHMFNPEQIIFSFIMGHLVHWFLLLYTSILKNLNIGQYVFFKYNFVIKWRNIFLITFPIPFAGIAGTLQSNVTCLIYLILNRTFGPSNICPRTS